jgi:hypothetical protein
MFHFIKSTPFYHRFSLILMLGLTLTPISLSASASGRIIHDPKLINSIANDVLNGLNETRMDEISLISGYGRLSVDIVPFSPTNRFDDVITPKIANELNTFLLAALIQKSQGKFRFHLNSIKKPRRQTQCRETYPTELCPDNNVNSGRLHNVSNADIIILGNLLVDKRSGYLSYKAYAPETGIILAATTPRKVHLRYQSRQATSLSRAESLIKNFGEYLEPSRSRIFRLQKDLRRLGFRPGRVNGYMTRRTRQAIQRYQWHHDLDPNGEVSDPLLKHIRKQVVLSIDRQTSDYDEVSRSD